MVHRQSARKTIIASQSQPHPYHFSNLSVPKPYDVCDVCSRDMAELVLRSPVVNLIKLLQSVIRVAIVLESEAIGTLANYTLGSFIKLIPGRRGLRPVTMKASLCS